MASLQINIDATGAKRGASEFQQATDAIKQSATQAASASESAATAFTHQGAASRATADAVKSQTLAQQALESSLRRIAEISAGLTIVSAFAAAAAKVKDLVAEGIRYNAVLEQQRTGIASIIAATNNIADAQGRSLQGAEKFNAAQTLASGLMKNIQQDALLTTATTEQLVEAFQSSLGPLSAAGLSLDQSRQATLKIVQAASALGVPMNQVAQEVRAIAEGSIDVNARLAKALGITNEQVKAAKEQGNLFEFIVDQTKAFAAAGDVTSRSFLGLSSSIADIASQLAGKALTAPFEGIKSALVGVLGILTDVNAGLEAQEKQAAATAHALQVLAETQQANRGAAEQFLGLMLDLGKVTLAGLIEGTQGLLGVFGRLLVVANEVSNILINVVSVGIIPIGAALKALVTGNDPLKAFSDSASELGNSFGNSAERIKSALTDVNFSLSGTAEILAKTNQFALSFIPTQDEVANAIFRVRQATDETGAALLLANGSAQQYTTSISNAGVAADEFAKKQRKLRDSLIESNNLLVIEANILEQARAQGLSYKEALAQVDVAKKATQSGDLVAAEANGKLEGRIRAVKEAYDADKKAAEESAAATKKATTEAVRHAEAIEKQREKLAAQTAVYQQVLRGVISLGDAEEDLKTHQLAVSVGSEKLAKDFLELEKNAKAYGAATELINKLSKEKAQLDIADNKANVESLRTLQEQGLALQEEGRLLAASLGPKAAIRDIEKEIALARIERTRQTELTTAKEHELTTAEEEQINANAELAKSLTLATDAQNRQADALKNSILSTGDVSNAFKGLAQGFFSGTQNLKKLVPDFFKGLAITAFGKFIEQKVFSLDQPLISNVNGLMGQGGILSSIFSFGGDLLGSIFGSGASDSAVGSFQAGWNGIFNGTGAGSVLNSATSAGASFGQTFGQIAGPIGVSIFLGQLTAGLFKGDSANLGARIGGFLGSLGAIVGGLFGGLFDHIPTKGTQIRKSVVDFLKEIKVSFADEINSKNYFFEETKTLAKQMFGGDFLAASKQVLNDKVGPELANQLKALGAFITADQAKQLGKPVEQTGTTFGNLLTANLGIDAIPDAISEIVQKSGITLDILVKKLNDLFKAKDIGVDFFKETIQGAVEIFNGALPEAIGVSKIALKSFAEDGTFDLEKFKKAVEAATGQFDVAVQTFLDAVNNNKPGEAAAEAFGKGLKEGLAKLARDQYLKNFIDNELFKGIDFSDGLNSSEIETLQRRTHDASIEADRLSKALGDVGDSADGTSAKIKELNDQLQELSNKRVQVQIDLAGQLGRVGALTPTQVIAAREQPLIPTVDRALNARGPIGTHPFSEFSDTELQKANDALKEMGDLAVDRFNAEESAANAALKNKIDAINTETQNTINTINQQTQATQDAIHAEFEAKRAAGQNVIDQLQKQKDIQSRVFQDQISGLQKALQVAQQFKQVSQSIQQTINSLTLSNSPLFKSERLAFLQRQAGELRGNKSAEAIEKLSQNLASQLQIGQEFLSPEQFAAQFTNVINELQTLRDTTGQQGDKAEDIQRNIESLQTQQVAALESIDAAISTQQKYLQSLSTSENNAIAAAQKAGAARITAAQEAGAARIAAAQAETKAAIDAYRAVIVARLNTLAAARDEILKEQAFRLKQQADVSTEQLNQLIDINANTQTMKELLASFLAANATGPITPAATGFQGIVDRPRLFLAGEAGRESVSITPISNTTNGGNVTFAPQISVTMQGSGTEADGRRLASAISQGLLTEWRTGVLGKEIRDYVRR